LCTRVEKGRICGECQMVDRDQIKKTVKSHCKITGKILIADQGVVSVARLWSDDYIEDAAVVVKPGIQKLPVQFDHIQGNFDVTKSTLTHMWGFPPVVDGVLNMARKNIHITQFTDYEPKKIGEWWMTYHKNLHLLKMIMADKIVLWDAPEKVQEIMDRYAGKGKTSMLNCALELKKAGYGGNARW
jgi:hypothetical protein